MTTRPGDSTSAAGEGAHRLDAIVTRATLLPLIDQLKESRELWGPVARAAPEYTPPTRYFYERVESADELALDFTYCVYGPKPVLAPARDVLFRFERSNGHFVTAPGENARPRALVGVHPCDLHAIRTLDAAFSRDVVDDLYAARRERLFIVGIDCPKPCTDGVFCADLETNTAREGFDVMLVPLDGGGEPNARYGVLWGTPAGRVWIERASTLSRKVKKAERTEFGDYGVRKRTAFPPELDLSREAIHELAGQSYRAPVWEAEAKRCYSCGSCNLVCPTCYCFDIQDANDLPVDTGQRVRLWDACMLRDFTVVAGGHNFRDKAAQRLRHRILRKMAWIEDRTAAPGCVGCGRCERACTARISIADIMKQLAREPEHACH